MSSNPAEADTAAQRASRPTRCRACSGAINGLRNRRALIAMIGCMVVGVLVAGLLSRDGRASACSSAAPGLDRRVGTGVNAAGPAAHGPRARHLAAQHRRCARLRPDVHPEADRPRHPAVPASSSRSSSSSRSLLFICKIPFLGPVLFVVVFPVSVVVAGVTVARPLPLHGAVAAGDLAGREHHARPVADAGDRAQPDRRGDPAARLSSAARLRVALIVFGVLGVGLVPTLGLSASIVGFGGFGSMMGAWAAWRMGGMGGMVAAASAMPSPAASAWRCSGRSPLRWWRRSTCSACASSTCASPRASTSAPPKRRCGRSSTRRAARASELGEKARAAANRATAPTPPAAGGDAAAAVRPTGAGAATLRRRRGRRWRALRRLVRGRAAADRSAPAYTPPSAYRRRRRPRPRPTSTCRSTMADDATPTAATSYSPPAYSPPAYVPPPAQPAAAGHAGRLDLPAVPFAGHQRRRVLRRLRLSPEVSRRRGPCLA